MKRLVINFGILCMILMVSPYLRAGQDGIIKKVVIDPGHGGKDGGAPGKNSHEKAIALKIALKLGDLIKYTHPDVEVIYTRKDDRFIELHKRTAVANKNNADLFISIHCNANKSKSIMGAETYVMGLHKSEQNLQVAKLENAAIFQEESYESTYHGFDPNSDEDHIALSMFQSAFLDQSLDFSRLIQNRLQSVSSRADRGVKQAGFLVLARATMPAVLIEVGFISNPNEELFLNSDKGQNLIAKSILNAFSEYKAETEKNVWNGNSVNSGKENKSAQESNKKPETSTPLNKSQSPMLDTPITNQESVNEGVKRKPEPVKIPKTDSPSSMRNEKTPVTPSKSQTKTGSNSGIKDEIVFMVQIHATKNRSSFKRKDIEKQYPLTELNHNGFIKFAVGKESSLSAASALCNKLRKSGFSDAFVIAIVNGRVTTGPEAQKLLDKQKK